jgi:hypothetical protein
MDVVFNQLPELHPVPLGASQAKQFVVVDLKDFVLVLFEFYH